MSDADISGLVFLFGVIVIGMVLPFAYAGLINLLMRWLRR